MHSIKISRYTSILHQLLQHPQSPSTRSITTTSHLHNVLGRPVFHLNKGTFPAHKTKFPHWKRETVPQTVFGNKQSKEIESKGNEITDEKLVARWVASNSVDVNNLGSSDEKALGLMKLLELGGMDSGVGVDGNRSGFDDILEELYQLLTNLETTNHHLNNPTDHSEIIHSLYDSLVQQTQLESTKTDELTKMPFDVFATGVRLLVSHCFETNSISLATDLIKLFNEYAKSIPNLIETVVNEGGQGAMVIEPFMEMIERFAMTGELDKSLEYFQTALMYFLNDTKESSIAYDCIPSKLFSPLLATLPVTEAMEMLQFMTTQFIPVLPHDINALLDRCLGSELQQDQQHVSTILNILNNDDSIADSETVRIVLKYAHSVEDVESLYRDVIDEWGMNRTDELAYEFLNKLITLESSSTNTDQLGLSTWIARLQDDAFELGPLSRELIIKELCRRNQIPMAYEWWIQSRYEGVVEKGCLIPFDVTLETGLELVRLIGSESGLTRQQEQPDMVMNVLNAFGWNIEESSVNVPMNLFDRCLPVLLEGIMAFGRCGDTDSIWKAWELVNNGVKETEYLNDVFTSFIIAFSTAGQPKQLLRFMNEWSDKLPAATTRSKFMHQGIISYLLSSIRSSDDVKYFAPILNTVLIWSPTLDREALVRDILSLRARLMNSSDENKEVVFEKVLVLLDVTFRRLEESRDVESAVLAMEKWVAGDEGALLLDEIGE